MNKGRGARDGDAAGGPALHIPVLLSEAVEALNLRPNGLYLDATFGAGGYSRAILAAAGTRLLATDRDPDAIAGGSALASAQAQRLRLARARFSELEAVAAEFGESTGAFDGVVFDLGASSMQFDIAERGFSFRREGPLDMRMDRRGRSAADLVNEEDEERLAAILWEYGEERASRRIARAIARERRAAPIATTRALAELVARAAPGKPSEIHPATRTFQALRIAVNDELAELEAGLSAAERLLAPGGRLVVVSFHSLEDRIVKRFLAQRAGKGQARSRLLPGEPAPPAPTFRLIGRQPIAPTVQECARNPRARSAKLRAAERTEAPPRAAHESAPPQGAL